MKTTKILASFLSTALVVMFACEKPELDPNLTPEGNANAFGTFIVNGQPQKTPFAASATLNRGADALSRTMTAWATAPVDAQIRWNSIDKTVNITKIDIYVTFTEAYLAADGSTTTANHGLKLLTTLNGPALRTDVKFSIPYTQIYDLYKAATFKYDGKTDTQVFGAASKRTATAPFLAGRTATNGKALAGDLFTFTWRLTSDKGLVYRSWSPSVCTEVQGANCSMALRVN
ncbi:hypothetical protein [Runella zeae]|uniref:hypothetical protein n=1 Tax=Runella zeae TaxID=94255 RepID=UPI00041B5B04|nr:hypothetical protein [Runella zeae]